MRHATRGESVHTMKYNKIALVLLPVFWPKMAPLGLAALKGHLSSSGVESKCFDLNNHFYNLVSDDMKKEWLKSCNVSFESSIFDFMAKEFKSELENIVKEIFFFPVVGLTVHRSNVKTVLKFSAILKQKNKNIRIILGGPEITSRYFNDKNQLEDLLDEKGDCIVVGEGEKPILSFLNGEIEDKTIVVNDEVDPKEFKVPDYSDFELREYPKSKSISVISSRGCIKKCAFCSERLMYKGFRVYSIETVLEQIEKHFKKGVSQFIFHDSLINGDLRYLDELCDAIIGKFGKINWEAQIAVRRDMPDKVFQKIKKSGCYHLFIGLESGSDKTLKNIKKGFSAKEAKHFFQKLNEHNLSFGISVIVGFPGETEEDFQESMKFIVENKQIIERIEQVNPFVFYEGIDLPEEYDYKFREESLKRTNVFIHRIKEEGFKYTKAFMKNLVEPSWK